MNHSFEVGLNSQRSAGMSFINCHIADCIKQCLIQILGALRLVIVGLESVPYVLKFGVCKVSFVYHAAKLMKHAAKS